MRQKQNCCIEKRVSEIEEKTNIASFEFKLAIFLTTLYEINKKRVCENNKIDNQILFWFEISNENILRLWRLFSHTTTATTTATTTTTTTTLHNRSQMFLQSILGSPIHLQSEWRDGRLNTHAHTLLRYEKYGSAIFDKDPFCLNMGNESNAVFLSKRAKIISRK